MRLRFAWICCAALALPACADGDPPRSGDTADDRDASGRPIPIGGGGRSDAALPLPDAAQLPDRLDAAPNVEDAAPPPRDATPVVVDAALPPPDLGAPIWDAERPEPDTAPPPPRDAAPPQPDAERVECRLNSDCDPDEYCADGRCTFDCREDRDCAEGETCSNGRCRAGPPPDPDAEVGPPGDGLVGSECAEDEDCDSRICLGVGVAGSEHRICATLCCTEGECLPNFACLNYAGAKFCLPDRIFPGVTFDRSAGQDCGDGVNRCRSGLCDSTRGRNTCLRTCCEDFQCGGLACVWTNTGGGPRNTCDIPLGFGGTGDRCVAEFECSSGVCAFDPAINGGTCAGLCCSNADCPANRRCGQVIENQSGSITSACLPLPTGPDPVGAACVDETLCETGHCIEGRCAEPCCSNADCPGAQRCDARPNGEGTLIRVCVD
jgi:hypothetical protein